MATEVELKLTLPSKAVANFLQDPQLGEARDVLMLDNQYFDTADLLLNKAHAALRIRKSQNGFKQTLKNKGTALAGLHIRGEWEYDIPDATLDWSLFPRDVQIDEKLRDQIEPIFKTDFSRHVWIKTFNNSEIELVLDQGSIEYGDRHVPLCEVELELIKGDAEDLFAFALELAKLHPLVPCDINKAERGYALLQPTLTFFSPQDFSTLYLNQTDFSLSALLQETLTRISRSWDDFSSHENWWSLLVLSRQVQGLAWMVNQLPSVPESLQQSLNELSDELVNLLEPGSVVIALSVDRHNHSRGLLQRLLQSLAPTLNEGLDTFIQHNNLGKIMLMLGQYLYEQDKELSFNEYLLSSLHNLQVSQWQENNSGQMQTLQGLAYLFRRLQHPAYPLLNQFITSRLVVNAMELAMQGLPGISDEYSHAKLSSWVRRLTVEQRGLADARSALFESLSDL